MGICKCSKKRVTSTFCFEHRVNVCEFCMVNSHPACIVQPYLQWLEDSSFKAKCSFCQLNLSNEECVRLLCYHVFHWTCLNKYCSTLPPNTAPAGYTCPDCNIPIFPSSSTPSPIYMVLKKKLATTEWARIGLGLPISQQSIVSNNNNNNKTIVTNSVNQTSTQARSNAEASNQIDNPVNTIQQTFEQKKNQNSNVFIHHSPHPSVGYEANEQSTNLPVSMNNVNNYLNNHLNNNHSTMINSTDYTYSNHNNFSSFNSSSRKIMDSDHSTDRDRLIDIDIDDDKYRTRAPFDRLFRYMKFINYKHNLNPNLRFFLTIGLFVLAALFIIYILVSLGRQTADNDPLLDPKFNPNLHFQDVDNFN